MQMTVCPRCATAPEDPFDQLEGYCPSCATWTGPAPYFGPMHYDIDGRAIRHAEYLQLLERKRTENYHRVAIDHIELYEVSTVWLGLDHGFGRGAPLIFETMVFLDGTVEDTYLQRYATKEEAMAGHEAVCAEIRTLAERAADQERINDGRTP